MCPGRVRFDQRAQFPDIEEQLYKEFRELRCKGVKVKGWWFKTRAKEILQSTHPDAGFKYSEGWFCRFKNRYKISFRRPTNTAQKEEAIQQFHCQIREMKIGSDETDGPIEERFGLHQTWTKLLFPFHLPVDQLMIQQTLQQSGFVVRLLDLTNGNVWFN